MYRYLQLSVLSLNVVQYVVYVVYVRAVPKLSVKKASGAKVVGECRSCRWVSHSGAEVVGETFFILVPRFYMECDGFFL